MNTQTQQSHFSSSLHHPIVRSIRAQPLIKGLDCLPPSWALTPVLNKRPLRPGWQNEDPIPRKELVQLLKEGQTLWSHKGQKHWHCCWNGYALRTGDISGGLLAIDIDGPSAQSLWDMLSQGKAPQTLCWTSGKTGRQQLLYQIPPSFRNALSTFSKWCIAEFPSSGSPFQCQAAEQIELRYNGCISVLPPSSHPETRLYRWIVSPQSAPVADAPVWLLNQLYEHHCQPSQRASFSHAKSNTARTSNRSHKNQFFSIQGKVKMFLLAPYLEGYDEEGREEWITCRCPVHGGEALDSLHIHPESGGFICHADCSKDEIYHAALAIAREQGFIARKQFGSLS